MHKYYLNHIMRAKPQAEAMIKGSNHYPNIIGRTTFYQLREGVIVYTQVTGLPHDKDNPFGVHGFHIHEGEICDGRENDPFALSGGHYNPLDKLHPYHAGDLPPLFANYGYAWNAVFTARFKVKDIVGRVVIIHKDPDDFQTQPTGSAGEKIACGKIK